MTLTWWLVTEFFCAVACAIGFALGYSLGVEEGKEDGYREVMDEYARHRKGGAR